MENLNNSLFLALNAPAEPSAFALMFATLLAKWVLYLLMLFMVVGWIRGARAMRVALLDTLLAIVLGLALNSVLAHLLGYSPRPFAAGLGHQFLAHAPDNSFPSDHGTFAFTFAFSLLFHRSCRGWGALALLLALGIAWSRIYLGVHFPRDMAGSFIVAIVSAGILRSGSGWLAAHLYPLAFRVYGGILELLHLPQGLFPRQD